MNRSIDRASGHFIFWFCFSLLLLLFWWSQTCHAIHCRTVHCVCQRIITSVVEPLIFASLAIHSVCWAQVRMEFWLAGSGTTRQQVIKGNKIVMINLALLFWKFITMTWPRTANTFTTSIIITTGTITIIATIIATAIIVLVITFTTIIFITTSTIRLSLPLLLPPRSLWSFPLLPPSLPERPVLSLPLPLLLPLRSLSSLPSLPPSLS